MVGGHLGSRWRGGKLGGQQVEGCREAWGQGCAGSWCRCACARAGGCNRGPAAPPGGGVPGLHSPCAHRHSLPPPPINPPLQPLTPPCPAPVLQNVPWCDAGGGGREVPVTRGVGREVLGPALARPGRRRGPHLALAAVEGGGVCRPRWAQAAPMQSLLAAGGLCPAAQHGACGTTLRSGCRRVG